MEACRDQLATSGENNAVPNRVSLKRFDIDERSSSIYNILSNIQNVQNFNYQHKLVTVMKAMETILGVTKAREKLSEIVESVQYQSDAYIISRHGRPAAAVVPVEVYESWKRRRMEFFDLVREFQDASGEADPDEVMQEVLQAQQAVRSQEGT